MLEGRLAPAVLTVNTPLDETTPDGVLSLREAVNVVNTQSTAGLSAAELTHITGTLGDNDTIRFSSSLVGKTIKLTMGEIAFDVDLTIQGPGASKLAISGNNAGRIFDIGPDATAVIIAGLTLKNGLSDQGGAILDDGSPLTLRSDVLSNDQGEQGGALAVLGEATAGMTVTITNCKFVNDAVIGAPGQMGGQVNFRGGFSQGGAIYLNAQFSAGMVLTVSNTSFTSDSATGGAGLNGVVGGPTIGGDGGGGQGGAVFIDAGLAAQPYFSFSTDTFSKCSAIGGAAGNGVDGDNGGDGGEAEGGALYYTSDFGAAPTLSVVTCTFASNAAKGGNAGAGGDAVATVMSQGNGGDGGDGGTAQGSAVFADFKDSAAGKDTFTSDSIHFNKTTGGNGGAGGSGFEGGAGGPGGSALGGGLSIINSDVAAATQLTIAQSAINNNIARGGNGGAGGIGSDGGGDGGFGNNASGGGLYFSSEIAVGFSDTWTLNADDFVFNFAIAGNGGAGGAGVTVGGNGGNSGSSGANAGANGGGIFDNFNGDLEILHCAIIQNFAQDGHGGSGGSGFIPGSDGTFVASDGGGLYIVASQTACQSADTVLVGGNNSADKLFSVGPGTLKFC
jgi:hypothetical protein